MGETRERRSEGRRGRRKERGTGKRNRSEGRSGARRKGRYGKNKRRRRIERRSNGKEERKNR